MVKRVVQATQIHSKSFIFRTYVQKSRKSPISSTYANRGAPDVSASTSLVDA